MLANKPFFMEANFDYKGRISYLVNNGIELYKMAAGLNIPLTTLVHLSNGTMPAELRTHHEELEIIQEYLSGLEESLKVPNGNGNDSVEKRINDSDDNRRFVSFNKSGASGPKRSKNRKPQQVVILEGYHVDPEAVKRARENESVWLFNQRTPEGKTQDFHNLNLDS